MLKFGIRHRILDTLYLSQLRDFVPCLLKKKWFGQFHWSLIYTLQFNFSERIKSMECRFYCGKLAIGVAVVDIAASTTQNWYVSVTHKLTIPMVTTMTTINCSFIAYVLGRPSPYLRSARTCECYCVRVVVMAFLSSLIATIRFHLLFDLPVFKLLCINFVSFGFSFSSPLRSSFRLSLFPLFAAHFTIALSLLLSSLSLSLSPLGFLSLYFFRGMRLYTHFFSLSTVAFYFVISSFSLFPSICCYWKHSARINHDRFH